jgi:hypothetical protein
MKFLPLSFLFIALACKTNPKNETPAEAESGYDSIIHTEVVTEERSWDYSKLYGQYTHENNGKGFGAILELTPLGNDLSFTLSLFKGKCEVKLDGIVGMIYHGETEYAGFYDNESCRLSFNFFLLENKIRVDEVGVCRMHPIGCTFDGSYIKIK